MSKKRVLCGHEVEAMSEEWLAERNKEHTKYNSGMVRFLPEGWLYPATALVYLDKIQSFQFRPDDVIVMTIPKSGTTWMQEILWTMVHNPDLDNPQAEEQLWNRSMDISFDMIFECEVFHDIHMSSLYEAFKKICPGKKEEDGICLQILEALPGRRIVKCHFPLQLMPSDLLQKTKVVYVARNPKDTAVSYYHFCKAVNGLRYRGVLEKFIRDFMQNELLYVAYWPHVLGAWEKRNHPNLHFVSFDDLKADSMSELHKLNDFLGTNLTEHQLQNVAQHTTFSSMKSRGEPIADPNIFVEEGVGSFYRKGVTSDWKNHLTAELNQEMDKWISDNVGDSGIPFKVGE